MSDLDWDSDRWGQPGTNVHYAAWAPDRHTDEPGDDQ